MGIGGTSVSIPTDKIPCFRETIPCFREQFSLFCAEQGIVRSALESQTKIDASKGRKRQIPADLKNSPLFSLFSGNRGGRGPAPSGT